MLPIVWSSLCIVKVAACGTLVSFSCEILQVTTWVSCLQHDEVAISLYELTFLGLLVQQISHIYQERSWLR